MFTITGESVYHEGAQWSSGRIFVIQPKGSGFESDLNWCVVTLEKLFAPLLLSTYDLHYVNDSACDNKFNNNIIIIHKILVFGLSHKGSV